MMQRNAPRLTGRWRVLLMAGLVAGALLGCGGRETGFTPPPPTIIRATEGEAATPAPPVEQPTMTLAPKATPQPETPSQDTPYPRPPFITITPGTPVVYPTPQS